MSPLSKLNGFLKGFAGFELRGIEFGNSNLLAGISRGHANAGSAVGNAKLAEARNVHFVPAPQLLVNHADKSIQKPLRLGMGNAQLGGQ